jgi:hypothetical protein
MRQQGAGKCTHLQSKYALLLHMTSITSCTALAVYTVSQCMNTC